MTIRRHILATVAVGVAAALSAQTAAAHEGPPPRFKACGPPFTYSDEFGKTITFTMVFPVNYVRQRADVVWLRLKNMGLLSFASGYVERWSDPPHAYNLAPQASHWFHTPVLAHHGGVQSVEVTVRPAPGRQSALGGRFWVPSVVIGCGIK